MSITEQQVLDALKPIEDPELHLGIVDLGLIYGAEINPQPDGEEVKLTMTFTSPFCPYGPQLKAAVQRTLATLPGVTSSTVNIVFTPPWDPRTMASEDCKIALGLDWSEEPDAGSDIENQR
ncbi:MAG: metal-sulfur cluster assembly factor [Candidatus Omnitrophica bacterium]|nr:metal-sulfur cluster assembly factor [Candidatus Omnitrophota bacterium]MBI3021534.1 metal-sulfur cluster assembly factor [Candidatus Omnitrophota bacterium]MBI3082923.1 metal-sulfur cluster assembly factor [Candidatus Omnitrophota bacterium]